MAISFQRNRLWAQLGGAALLLGVIVWQTIEWGVNRVYVPQGNSLLLQYKGPLPFEFWASRKTAQPGQFAAVDKAGRPIEIGVLERMRGPGRHFFCPLWWKAQVVPDVLVTPGEVAVFSSRMGGDLPHGEFLVDGELGQSQFKGILRRVYGPGVYRVNPYAYDHEIKKMVEERDGLQVKHSGWVDIPTGYVGVVTNQTSNPLTKAQAGIQNAVLPPGLYPINPREQKIDIVEVGLRERTIAVVKKRDASGQLLLDDSGEAVLDDTSGISFPSSDGFTIHMDFTTIWGIMPDQAADTIAKFGTVQNVEDKVVVPQIESICRNHGSQLGAVELLVGDTREAFQTETAAAFHKALEEKNLTLQQGLVRYIYIPQEIRTPIRQRYLADELTLTRSQEELTAKTEAELRRAEKEVELEAARTEVETEKLAAEEIALGQKTAAETKAKTAQLVAEINKKTAELESQATVLLGQAEANAQQLLEEAKADKFQLAVEAFGSGAAYNQWVFATGLPDDVRLHLLYAGEGTFWTDLKGFTETMLGRQAAREKEKAKP